MNPWTLAQTLTTINVLLKYYAYKKKEGNKCEKERWEMRDGV